MQKIFYNCYEKKKTKNYNVLCCGKFFKKFIKKKKLEKLQ